MLFPYSNWLLICPQTTFRKKLLDVMRLPGKIELSQVLIRHLQDNWSVALIQKILFCNFEAQQGLQINCLHSAQINASNKYLAVQVLRVPHNTSKQLDSCFGFYYSFAYLKTVWQSEKYAWVLVSDRPGFKPQHGMNMVLFTLQVSCMH